MLIMQSGEREKFSGDFLENKLSYWRKLSDINISLPVDHQSTSVSYDGDSVPIVILAGVDKKIETTISGMQCYLICNNVRRIYDINAYF